MSMEIVEVPCGEVFFFDDLLGSENDNNNEPVMWNGRQVIIRPMKKAAPHVQYLLAMMRAPDEGKVSGGYSQEKGAYGEFKLKWKNQPSPNSSPNKEKEPPPSNSSPNKGKALSSKDDKTAKKENPSKDSKKN